MFFFIFLALVIIFVAIIAIIVRRWTILLMLSIRAREQSEKGTKARFRLFLVALTARGFRPKNRNETPHEYGLAYPELERIMSLYEVAVFHPASEVRSLSRAQFDSGTREFLASRRGVTVLLRSLSGFYDRGLL